MAVVAAVVVRVRAGGVVAAELAVALDLRRRRDAPGLEMGGEADEAQLPWRRPISSRMPASPLIAVLRERRT